LFSCLVRLNEWWFEIFPDVQLPKYGINDCPILIGMVQHAAGERGDFSPFEYQCQVLQRCDLLPKTNDRSTLENILETLCTFREEWRLARRSLLSFDVIGSTGLCPDVLVEVSKYLLLDEAINAFSARILPLLRQMRVKVHLKNPSRQSLVMFDRCLDSKQIVSLRVTDDVQRRILNFSAFRMFDQLAGVTVLSETGTDSIDDVLQCLPNVRHFSLWFGVQFGSDLCQNLFNRSFHPNTHLHIRSAGMRCDPFWTRNQINQTMKNTTIISLTIDSTYKQVNQTSSYFSRLTRYLRSSNPPMKFIESLSNVQRVRLVVNRNEIDAYLQIIQWKNVISECLQLDRVIIRLVSRDAFTREAMDIEEKLRRFRPGMIFRIKSA
jgi:hypothetical protein